MSSTDTQAPASPTAFTVCPSPHAHSGSSVRGLMLDVVVALLPACAAALWFFGRSAALLIATCVATCLATEHLCRLAMRRDRTLCDGSALVTGLLLALNLPPGLPPWQAMLGSVVAIAVAKQAFGGLGYNPFNPALVARAVLLTSFTATMTTWTASDWSGLDAYATATPLGASKELFKAGALLPFEWDLALYGRMALGNINGCIGETSAVAIALGGLYLLARKVITWHVPVAFIGTVALFAAVLRVLRPELSLPVPAHLLGGGLALGAFFMATDMVTSPVTRSGLLLYGVGCGVLTMVLRTALSGDYPEGVSFAILIMNAFSPLINRATRPRRFGTVRPRSERKPPRR